MPARRTAEPIFRSPDRIPARFFIHFLGPPAVMMKPAVNVAITGAAGQIGYALAFRVASGQMLGADTPVNLHLLEVTPALPQLAGVVMELNDCAFPTLNKIVATDDAKVIAVDPGASSLAKVSKLQATQGVTSRLEQRPPTGQDSQVLQGGSLLNRSGAGGLGRNYLKLLELMTCCQQKGDRAIGQFACGDQELFNLRVHGQVDHRHQLAWVFDLEVAYQNGGIGQIGALLDHVAEHMRR